jgi:hypothetical protein
MPMNNDDDFIYFTYDDYKSFEKVYGDTVDKKKETFMFKGKEFYVGYAKYLLEYLITLNRNYGKQ